jgi:hypothetical protein
MSQWQATATFDSSEGSEVESVWAPLSVRRPPDFVWQRHKREGVRYHPPPCPGTGIASR